jgi:hypothetical protein
LRALLGVVRAVDDDVGAGNRDVKLTSFVAAMLEPLTVRSRPAVMPMRSALKVLP